MKIDIIHATAGEGHRKIAVAVQEAFARSGHADLDIRVIDALDHVSPVFKATYAPIYYWAVRHAPTLWGASYDILDQRAIYNPLRPMRALTNSMHCGPLLKTVLDRRPDVVVSTHFLAPELLGRAKRAGRLNARLITVISDYFPHTFWANPGTDHYWVMAEETKAELVRRGIDPARVTAGGIPISAAFRPAGKRSEILKKHGFEDGRFTLLLTSGSFGLGPQEAILEELKAFQDKVQCFVVCARNEALRKRLDEKLFYFPVKVFGFVDFMPELMEASDLMIAKSGGSTTTEALAKNLCMVVMEPIPGQETRNAKLLKMRNAAFFLKKPGDIRDIMRGILSDPTVMVHKQRAIAGLSKPAAADDLVYKILEGNI
ncbi:MAG TPA: glycosyltransferase [Candidatus Omnitrophota bacterium]|nr:MAG: Processive diacylglycerol beta-glucosyltransferase [Candidatus Omnitrophica bacterium ADurb.Bin314]HOE69437.1 glycosyltransferase [Candidatus Omnitrophota bacterium]HQB94686.1 glycosyltransferase [Candidatus Omnitrophota bacterium]